MLFSDLHFLILTSMISSPFLPSYKKYIFSRLFLKNSCLRSLKTSRCGNSLIASWGKFLMRPDVNCVFCVFCVLIMLFTYRNGHDQQTSPNTQDVPTQSWYPSSAVGSSPTSSHLSTQGNMQHRDRIQSPAEAARIIACLKDKRLG